MPPGRICGRSRVRDEGCGIAAGAGCGKIFEPFVIHQAAGRRAPGWGCRWPMASSNSPPGSSLPIRAKLGKGSTFTMYFPAHRGDKQAAETVIEGELGCAGNLPKLEDLVEAEVAAHAGALSQPTHAAPTALGGVVLLVEDEAPVRAFASARAAAARLHGDRGRQRRGSAENQLEDDKPCMWTSFVTDVVMPGMDGPSWVSQALREPPRRQGRLRVGLCRGQRSHDNQRQDPQFGVPAQALLAQSELTETVQAQLR